MSRSPGGDSFSDGNRKIANEALQRAFTPPGGGGGGITQLTGDVLAGPGAGAQAARVVRVNGATVPIAGALTPGNVLQVTGASALGYGPVNLALPASVTGALAITSIAPGANGQFLQTQGGVTTWGAAPGVTFPLLAPDGSPSVPEYSFAAAPTTGMYRDTVSSNLRFAVGGNYAAGFDVNGTLYGFQSASVGPVGVPFTLGVGPGSDSTWLFVGANIGTGFSNLATLRGSSGQTFLNCPTSGLGFGLHLSVDGADFIQCGGAAGTPDQVCLAVQGSSNLAIFTSLYSTDFGTGKQIIGILNAVANVNIESSIDKGAGYLWTDTRTDGQPQGLVVCTTGGIGGLGNGARSAVAPCGLGSHNTQQGDEICERGYGRTTIGASDTTTVTIPLENGTLNGQVRFTGRLVTPGGGGGTTGDSFFATYNIRIKVIAGVVTVPYFTIDGAGTAGSDASMAGALFTATPSGAAVAIKIDATAIASGAGSVEDWQADLFKVFVN